MRLNELNKNKFKETQHMNKYNSIGRSIFDSSTADESHLNIRIAFSRVESSTNERISDEARKTKKNYEFRMRNEWEIFSI